MDGASVNIQSRPDLSRVPLKALGQNSLYQLSLKLNAQKLIRSEKGHLRDWRGLAQLVGFAGDEVAALGWLNDPLSKVLEQWAKLPSPNVEPNLASLQTLLGELDRWDIYDDTESLLVSDADVYLKSLDSRCVELEADVFKDALTQDDQDRLQKGLPLQIYDGLLLYANEDVDHAKDIVDSLESKGLKICVKERDLMVGVFEHSAMLKLIADRCSRLIVIFSKAFLNTDLNRFLVSYAQSVGIGNNQRKVIPVIFEDCIIPTELNFNFRLKYTSNTAFYNFYDKLYESVRPSHMLPLSAMKTQAPALGAIRKVPGSPARRKERGADIQPMQAARSSSYLCEQPFLEDKLKENKFDSCESGYLSDSVLDAEPAKPKSLFKKMVSSTVHKLVKTKKKKKKVALEAY